MPIEDRKTMTMVAAWAVAARIACQDLGAVGEPIVIWSKD